MVLSDEARELRNARARAYYKNHKKQYAEANRRYWEKQAAKAKAEAEAQTNAPTQDAETPPTDGESANGANEKVTE